VVLRSGWIFSAGLAAMISALEMGFKSALGSTLRHHLIRLMSAIGVFTLLGVAIGDLRQGVLLVTVFSFAH
jgi:hypothetical protein